MKRREFLRVVGSAASVAALSEAAAVGHAVGQAAGLEERVAGMPRRKLGRTGEVVSIICFPGLALVHKELDQASCTRAVQQAFARGINYFDVAPAYGKGVCETRLGLALEGISRAEIFLACKTGKRDQEDSRIELEQSLKLLKTDYFDLYQLHHLRTVEEVKRALGPGGAVETLDKARKEGKVKYLGFSAHTTAAGLEAMRGFRFDTVMFPINFVDYYQNGFGKEVMELANQQGAALISIKPMSHGAWPEGMARNREWWYRCTETQEEVEQAVRWTLSLPGLVSAVPPSWLDLLDKAIEAAQSYRPATPEEIRNVKLRAAGLTPLFEVEERQAALGSSHAFYPDCPHHSYA
jgi:predicted aldo/keto reductase-like oxidoreductase